ncbi:MAG: hypothetical protein JST79_19555 [Acidobacteria bacterium]|nr:hypothetical protein [Acidobacteriota bacterium]
MKSNHSRIFNHRVLSILVVGIIFAVLTFSLDWVPWWRVEKEIPEALNIAIIGLLTPGLIASMVISGNVHAFPLWTAALVNGAFYGMLARLFLWLVARRQRS